MKKILIIFPLFWKKKHNNKDYLNIISKKIYDFLILKYLFWIIILFF